jgi:anaerobic magnesium-protoporphyrin IX monomethyl ester cyclase
MVNSVSLQVLNSTQTARRGNTSRPVMLIGFQDQGNLGLGYLASTVSSYGYRVAVYDVETESARLLEAAQTLHPILIGFSLIFQFYIHRFNDLIEYLRRNGVSCHFTMGGHFPSLSYRETLELAPGLDSVVRFEGELTLLELVDCLSNDTAWQGIQGIAFRQGDQIVTTALRPLVDDLDCLPHPRRDFMPMETLSHTLMPLLASRGCARTCSFCSIQTFYRTAPGKIVRTRKPAKVVEEMSILHEERGTTIFLFQDDDFPLFGPVWRRWAGELIAELHRARLPGRVIWKMNCRADAVDLDLFSSMRDAGLYLVYMGLESGNDEGLKTLHKQITVQQNLRAVEILKGLGLMFEYGFMLFDPSSTFESVRANLHFLRTIVGDGSAPVVFCRMLPYDGTPIKEDLVRSGRLRGDVCNPDYDFLDARLNEFYEALTQYVDIRGWIHGYQALSLQLNWILNELAVLERLFPPVDGLVAYKETLRKITQSSNNILLQVVEDLCMMFSDGTPISWTPESVDQQRVEFLEELASQRTAFLSRNQEELLHAIRHREFAPTVRT